MTAADDFRQRARQTWADGDWDAVSRLVAPVGPVVLDAIKVEPGMDLLDVGTGSGGTVAIPAALRGAKVVGCDITPELFVHAWRRAAEANVEVEWVEGDAQDLPFDDASFDRVTSTFGAMLAPDHARVAQQLMRVCRPGGRVGMTTWADDGFAGGLFKLTGSYMPTPPAGVQTPQQWGSPDHVREMFATAGVTPKVARRQVEFAFDSEPDAVQQYAEKFGPFIALRGAIEPQGRWEPFIAEFAELVHRFNSSGDNTAKIGSDYLLITAQR
jgi:ubiquinone/menaquinone biosynthesis C-methylase UbiE